MNARYVIENRGELPETFAILALDIVADPDRCAPGLAPEGQRTPMAIARRVETLAPDARVELDLRGDSAHDARWLYHVDYHHEARFRVGAEEIVVRAGDLYFRLPHRIR
jgi:hypothetical protein